MELLERALVRLDRCEPGIAAFSFVDRDGARQQALDRRAEVRAGGPLGPLHGVPVAVKDLYDVAGQVTRAGSLVAPGSAADRDATAVARLRAAGAVIVGRTRTHEFAWGLTTQHPVVGGTRNPWDTGRVPGGSSGGSAAAVAAGVVPLALGTDTGGSIRLPAAWCGLTGHKPSYGSVPMAGVLPLAASLDHGGALVRDAADARLALQVLSGRPIPDPRSPRGLRLGVVRQTAGPHAAVPQDEGVARALREAVGRAAEACQTVPSEVDLPFAEDLAGIYAAVQGPEALAWHRATGRWPAHGADYGEDVRSHLRRCEQLDPERARWAVRLRHELRDRVAALFAEVDLLLLPVASCGPPDIACPDVGRWAGATGRMRDAVLPWTVLANLCGLPACSVPAGLDDDGLPVGLQIVGPYGADARVLDLAAALR